MKWYLKALQQYADFGGRARRTEYWMFFLFNLIINVVLQVLAAVDSLEMLATAVLGIYSLAVLIPGLAVTVRRLHDTDRSGWWILIALVPLIGAIVLLVFMCLEGTRGPNRFGPDPKRIGGPAPQHA